MKYRDEHGSWVARGQLVEDLAQGAERCTDQRCGAIIAGVLGCCTIATKVAVWQECSETTAQDEQLRHSEAALH